MSLLALLCVCDGRHGALPLAHVADARPLAVHRLLPQSHLQKTQAEEGDASVLGSAPGEEEVFTLLSPPETARMFPVMDQLTCQTTSLNLCSSLAVHVFPAGSSHVQMKTRPSCRDPQSHTPGPTVRTVPRV